MICIYCLTDKSPDDFNREHVLPEGFGRFKHGLVLHEEVCEDCNSYFGKTIDRALGRSTSEGLERYSWHVKPADEADNFRYGDVLLQLSAPDTDWDKALVKKVPTEIPGESRIELVPQALFQKKDGSGVKRIPLWELRRGAWKDDDSIDPNIGARVLAPADLFDEVVAVLAQYGVTFNTVTELPAPQSEDGEFTIEHLFSLSEELQRAVAKIGFNYFACTNGSAAAIREEHHAVRRFVRYGEKSGEPIVALVPTSRLGISREDGQIPVVHYLTVEFDDSETAILAHVTLFHWAVYQIVVAEGITNEYPLRVSGHLFNIGDMTCYEMGRRTNV